MHRRHWPAALWPLQGAVRPQVALLHAVQSSAGGFGAAAFSLPSTPHDGPLGQVRLLGIDRQGNKHVLGPRKQSTESPRVVRSLLSDLVERGLDADRARLWVIDGDKALRRAIIEYVGHLGADPSPTARAT